MVTQVRFQAVYTLILFAVVCSSSHAELSAENAVRGFLGLMGPEPQYSGLPNFLRQPLRFGAAESLAAAARDPHIASRMAQGQEFWQRYWNDLSNRLEAEGFSRYGIRPDPYAIVLASLRQFLENYRREPRPFTQAEAEAQARSEMGPGLANFGQILREDAGIRRAYERRVSQLLLTDNYLARRRSPEPTPEEFATWKELMLARLARIRVENFRGLLLAMARDLKVPLYLVRAGPTSDGRRPMLVGQLSLEDIPRLGITFSREPDAFGHVISVRVTLPDRAGEFEIGAGSDRYQDGTPMVVSPALDQASLTLQLLRELSPELNPERDLAMLVLTESDSANRHFTALEYDFSRETDPQGLIRDLVSMQESTNRIRRKLSTEYLRETWHEWNSHAEIHALLGWGFAQAQDYWIRREDAAIRAGKPDYFLAGQNIVLSIARDFGHGVRNFVRALVGRGNGGFTGAQDGRTSGTVVRVVETPANTVEMNESQLDAIRALFQVNPEHTERMNRQLVELVRYRAALAASLENLPERPRTRSLSEPLPLALRMSSFLLELFGGSGSLDELSTSFESLSEAARALGEAQAHVTRFRQLPAHVRRAHPIYGNPLVTLPLENLLEATRHLVQELAFQFETKGCPALFMRSEQ